MQFPETRDHALPCETRDYALAQASLEHAIYFLELGAYDRAAAYFSFAAQRLQSISQSLLMSDRTPPRPKL